MKILLDIPDDQAHLVLAKLKDLNFVKIKQISDDKAELLKNIKQGIDEIKLIKAGKIKRIAARDLLKGL